MMFPDKVVRGEGAVTQARMADSERSAKPAKTVVQDKTQVSSRARGVLCSQQGSVVKDAG